MAKKPLMLKEYLELESSSESFRRGPTPQRANRVTVRCLLDTELRVGGADSSPRLGLSRSKIALRRLSAVIGAIRILQSPSTDSPLAASGGWRGSPARRLTRTFSKKLRLGFWKKSGRQGREGKESKVLLKDIVRLRSFREDAVEKGHFTNPSPVVSSFDGGGSTGSDIMPSSAASSALFENEKHESPLTSPRPDLSPTPTPHKEMFGGVGENSSAREPKENSGEAMDCPSEEEKEQLSPVAVMDFPYQDDDDDDDDDEEVELPSPTSLCFPQNITNIERTKNQHLQKIRRFESLAELNPVDLDHRFARAAESTIHVAVVEQEEEDACALLRRLDGGEPFPAWDEKLLFDFFVDELSLNGKQCRRGTKGGGAGDEELLREASGWVHGGGGAQRNGDAVVLGEMDRSVGWRRCEEEEEMVAAEMAGGLVAWLVEELAVDMVLSA